MLEEQNTPMPVNIKAGLFAPEGVEVPVKDTLDLDRLVTDLPWYSCIGVGWLMEHTLKGSLRLA